LCTRTGTPFSPRYVIRQFKAMLARAGLPETIRVHDLRHTFVSFMLAENVPASDVQKIACPCQLNPGPLVHRKPAHLGHGDNKVCIESRPI
jgi:site-specific recombinase XerC